MYCPNCGAHNDETYNNCISCGKYIADINKDIIRKKEEVYGTDLQESETVNSEPETLLEKPVVITEKVNDYVQENSNVKQTEKKYNESIYRQNIKKPKDYFIFSLLCAALGSLSFGIAALIFSAMTKAENISGNISKATVYSEKTKVFCILSAIIGALKYIFIIGIIFDVFYSTRYYSPYMW